MKAGNNGQLTARDIPVITKENEQVMIGVDSALAIIAKDFGVTVAPEDMETVIRNLGGIRDTNGRWIIRYERFCRMCYNFLGFKLSRKGGELNMVKVEEIVRQAFKWGENHKWQASLSRRKGQSDSWYIRLYRPADKKQKFISLGIDDAELADDILTEIKARKNNARLSMITPYPTSVFFEECSERAQRRVKPKSACRYDAVLAKAVNFLPGQVDEITKVHIIRYRDYLEANGYHPNTIRFELNTLGAIFDDAVERGYMESNPLAGKQGQRLKPKKVKAQRGPYSDDELEAIFAELDRRCETGFRSQSIVAWRMYRELFWCLRLTGLRISDALALQWNQVNLSFNVITLVQTKTEKPLEVTVPSALKERLLRLISAESGNPNGFVFTTTTGHKVSYSLVDSAIRSLLAACGIEKKSPVHSFRHSYAQSLTRAGLPISEVAFLLGDTLATTVANYVKAERPTTGAVDAAFVQHEQPCKKIVKKVV